MSKYKLIPELTTKQLRNFWLKVDKRGPDDCWPWLGCRSRAGYGKPTLHPFGKFYTPRVMYCLATGKQPGPLCVLHKCDNPGCCNPAHLFLGTHADNAADRDAKGRSASHSGEDNGKAKLTERQVLKIRVSNEGGVALAIKYGVTRYTISNIRLRKTWKHI